MPLHARPKVSRRGVERLRAALRKKASQSFSLIEDRRDASRQIVSLAKKAVLEAALENKRHGLPYIVLKGNEVFEVSLLNHQKIATVKESKRKYKVGEVLNARKG